jgi:hypothetical protein
MTAERRPIRWYCGLRVAACALVLIAGAGRVSAQQDEDSGVWIGGFANGKLPPSLNDDRGAWRLWTDIQLRFGDDVSRFSQGVFRPGIGYAFSRGWTIWAGYAYVRTEAPYATSTMTEHRIWEQAIWSGALGSTALSSRTRLEQRFVSTGSNTGWRLREFVKVAQPLKSPWFGVVSDEFFANLNTTDFGASAGSDRNRFFIGPGVRLGGDLSMEIGYLNQYTFRSNGPDKNDQLFAANVFWSF